MQIEGVSKKTSMVINQVVNLLLAVAMAVHYYDGFVSVAGATAVYFALMNVADAVFAWGWAKFKKGE